MNANTDRVAILTGFTVESHSLFLSTVVAAAHGEGEVDFSVLRRSDGGPVTDEHRRAVMEMTTADLDAVNQYYRRQAEQAEHEYAVAEEAAGIFRRYAPKPGSAVNDVLPLMTEPDRARFLELSAQLL